MPNDGDLPHKSLRAWRDSKFLTQEELAKIVGVDPHSISDWEVGRTGPQPRNIRALAEALGIKPEQIDFAKSDPAAA